MDLTAEQRRWLNELFTHVYRGSGHQARVINRGVEPSVTSIRGQGYSMVGRLSDSLALLLAADPQLSQPVVEPSE